MGLIDRFIRWFLYLWFPYFMLFCLVFGIVLAVYDNHLTLFISMAITYAIYHHRKQKALARADKILKNNSIPMVKGYKYPSGVYPHGERTKSETKPEQKTPKIGSTLPPEPQHVLRKTVYTKIGTKDVPPHQTVRVPLPEGNRKDIQKVSAAMVNGKRLSDLPFEETRHHSPGFYWVMSALDFFYLDSALWLSDSSTLFKFSTDTGEQLGTWPFPEFASETFKPQHILAKASLTDTKLLFLCDGHEGQLYHKLPFVFDTRSEKSPWTVLQCKKGLQSYKNDFYQGPKAHQFIIDETHDCSTYYHTDGDSSFKETGLIDLKSCSYSRGKAGKFDSPCPSFASVATEDCVSSHRLDWTLDTESSTARCKSSRGKRGDTWAETLQLPGVLKLDSCPRKLSEPWFKSRRLGPHLLTLDTYTKGYVTGNYWKVDGIDSAPEPEIVMQCNI